MKTAQSKNLYKVMQHFANLTIRFIVEGNMRRAEKCFLIADQLFTKGNMVIKNAIANVYVSTISYLLDQRDEHYTEVMQVLPYSLKREYEAQVNALGV